MQWIYGLFLDLMSYCANALLGIMSTDLTFFEQSVPIVPNLYKVFVAVGWGLLIGNCAFQSMKAMFAGLGFETESPAILLVRTGIFGTLLIFSKDICEIGLSIGKNVIDLLGIPGNITLTMPTDSMFTGLGASWLLVIIIGFILGFQLIKLFFEIAERYVVVAVLTLLCPVGLAMGGSKSTKDICVGFMRTYASMIVMMVMNVLFLKLILSALATMPSGALVLPWCLLVVGIAKTARKADQLISKIGLNPAITGDPLGAGRGLLTVAMLTRTVMAVAGKGGGGKVGGGAKGTSGGNTGGNSYNNSARNYGGNNGSTVHNASGGTNVNANNTAAGAAYATSSENAVNTQRNNQSSNFGGVKTNANTQTTSNVRFGAATYGGVANSANNVTGKTQVNGSGNSRVNTNRFGSQPNAHKQNGVGGSNATQGKNVAGNVQGNTTAKGTQPSATSAKTITQNGKTSVNPTVNQTVKGASKTVQKNAAQQATQNAKKARFGGAQPTKNGVHQNTNPIGKSKPNIPNVGGVKTTPNLIQQTVKSDNAKPTDTAKEVLQDITETITSPKDGENDG